MSNFFYKGVDISQLISNVNAYDGSSKSILTNYYTGFPTISNTMINNSNFDKSLNVNTGYSTGNVPIDIASQLPSCAVFYNSTLNTNSYSWPANAINTAFDSTTCTFNSPRNYTINISNIYNSIGVILCGGGGGGGGSGINNNNGSYSGTSGGGGGFVYAKNIDLNIYGRSWALSVGGGGYSGMFPGPGLIGVDGQPVSGGTGGSTTFISNINASYLLSANGGGGGGSSNNDNGTTSAGNSNNNVPNTVNYTPIASNGGNYGGRGSLGHVGGDCAFNAQTTNYTSEYISKITLNGSTNTPLNNCAGYPAGGDVNNQYGNANNSGGTPNVIFYRNGTNPTNGTVTSLTNFYGSGGGGSGGQNAGRRGNSGGCGSPGFAIIYYYL